MTDTQTAQELLTPQEVAMLFGVDPKTVTRWARAGRLNAIRTLGGHRRYLGSEVRALITPSIPTQASSRD
ncbi:MULTISPECIES: BldC family transcriptional regulator [Cellulomonas]|uniref:DNA-binding protein n=1 Tax=Cellulomonas uda TaxID=1714 RepID=A0A4Y3KEK8_CELUD|nr:MULTISPECIES: BldC family transcriptional regulator [Cellulomonas]ASR56490.1 MerR family DNA-binding transcriptional regulator [Cellulomonas sp. PSBB021]NII67560.1 excisionase family DNA binding protein [Cellulomonas uda]GEA81360.1 DNA-binding protein [Cellulomonas uda]